jgi:hypothetical protein
MTNNFLERRRHPRVAKELALKIKTDKYDLVTRTQNLSCIGAYCSVNKYIPALTKLSIMLLLPTKGKNTHSKVQCKGVVVRTEDNPPSGFNVAIYFNDINQHEKEKISKYINQYLL